MSSVAGVIDPTLQAAEIRRAVDQPSNNPTTYDLYLRALQTNLGQLDEAKITIERLRGLTPVVLPNADNWRDPEQHQFYLPGLLLAMSGAASPSYLNP